MILKRYREQRFIRKSLYIPIDEIVFQLENIRKNWDTIAICPQTTGGNWQGVKTATLSLFPDNTFIFPQYFSNSVYTHKDLNIIAEKIAEQKFRNIVFSGFPSYFEYLIKRMQIKPEFGSISIIYHGSLSSNAEDEKTIPMLNSILSLYENGDVQKIGFVKKGMSETFQRLRKINAHHLLLKTVRPRLTPVIKDTSLINIGVFSHDQYRKNIHNQVAAALMVDNSKVYVRKNYGFEYLKNTERIEVLGFFNSYDDFLAKAISMDINLYVSFSECWGQVITESLSYGIPCLLADNSGVMDYDDELKELLVVKEFDDSMAISEKIKAAIPQIPRYRQRMIDYIDILNQKADEKLQGFLNNA